MITNLSYLVNLIEIFSNNNTEMLKTVIKQKNSAEFRHYCLTLSIVNDLLVTLKKALRKIGYITICQLSPYKVQMDI